MIDRLFDILNSHNPRAMGSKAPLGALNWTESVDLLLRGREYLLSLVMKDGTPLHQTKRFFKILNGFHEKFTRCSFSSLDLVAVCSFVSVDSSVQYFAGHTGQVSKMVCMFI